MAEKIKNSSFLKLPAALWKVLGKLVSKPAVKKFALFFLLICFLPWLAGAQSPSSTNYRLDSSEFDFGGGYGSSANYGSRDSLGNVETGRGTSSNYRVFPGFFPRSYPGVPAQPVFTNTGGILYNALDFVIQTGGNTSDVNYAIAISPDNFATTYFVQADNTVGSGPVWQSYISWGAAGGQRITGLLSSTVYSIKIKAHYGPDSDTGYSQVSQAATVAPSFAVTILGLGSGTTIGSFTTNIASTPTSVPFSTLQTGSIKVGAQRITVTTNAAAGYSVALFQDHDLAKTNGTVIPPVASSNASPAAWPGAVTSAAFGYHTTDSTLCTGSAGRFSADNTFAASTSTPYEVACNTASVNNEVTNLVYKVEVESLQASGEYRNNLVYIITPQY